MLRKVINKYLNIEVNKNELKKYNSSFITGNFENREVEKEKNFSMNSCFKFKR